MRGLEHRGGLGSGTGARGTPLIACCRPLPVLGAAALLHTPHHHSPLLYPPFF